MNHPVMGLVLHIEEGSEAGTSGWFHNPQAQVSAHFGVSKDGKLQQWVDTNDKAWAITSGDRYWKSVENEGMPGDALTLGQLSQVAKVLAWLHGTDGVPVGQNGFDPATRSGLARDGRRRLGAPQLPWYADHRAAR